MPYTRLLMLQVRQLSQAETEISWMLIAWNVEEPVFVVEGRGHRSIADVFVEEDCALKVFWIDDVARLGVR